MRKFGFVAAAVALGVVQVVNPALAASSSHQLGVAATVQGSCRFNSGGPTALSFGAIDPSATTNATASATVLYRCTNGTSASISKAGANDAGGNHRLANGSDFIIYTATLSGDAQTGTGYGAGQDKTLDVSGVITPADFQNAPAGNYTDTLTLTISP